MIAVFKGKDEQWYWHVRSRNGQVIAQSEGYTTKGNAKQGAKALIRTLQQQPTKSLIESIDRA